MKIKKIDLTRTHNDEHFQFMQFVLALTKEIGAATLNVEPQNDALIAVHEEEDEALKKIMKSALTAEINEADHARDRVFRGMANAVLSAEDHFSAAVRNAGVHVQIVFDAFGNVAEKSHIEETSAIYNLLKELTDKHAADVTALNLSPWITELDRLNKEVENLLEKRADEGAELTPLVLRAVRKRVDDAYRALTAMAEAQALVASVAPPIPPGELKAKPAKSPKAGGDNSVYDGFFRRLNERIDMLNQALAIRRGIAKKKDEAKPQPQPPKSPEGGVENGKL